MSNIVYNKCKYLLASGGVDLDTSDIRVALVTSAYTPNVDHNFLTDLTNELVGTGYARQALDSKTVTEDDTNDRAYFDAADETWTGINAGVAAMAIIFLHTGVDATASLLACVDLTPAITTNGGDLTVQWNAGGIIRLA